MVFNNKHVLSYPKNEEEEKKNKQKMKKKNSMN